MLRVEDGTVEYCRLVVTSVVVLQLGLDISLFEILLEESCELRQLGVVGQLGYIDVRKIELVGDEQRLLFVYTGLRCNRPDEDVL